MRKSPQQSGLARKRAIRNARKNATRECEKHVQREIYDLCNLIEIDDKCTDKFDALRHMRLFATLLTEDHS